MPVTEAPFWDQFPGFEGTFAPEGAFVLVRIDPVASVAVLEDEEATRAAAALDKHEWVLGVITGCRGGGFFDPMNKPLMSLQIELCGQGPPDDKPIASIPILPSPQLYDDRPPVQLNSPLPWPNIYFHTNFCSSVIISRIHQGAATFEAAMTKAQYEDLSRRAFRDRYNWHNLPPETVPEPTDVILVDPDRPERLSDYCASEDSSDDGRDSLYAREMENMGFKIARQRIYGEISLDPSMCPGALGAPAQMREPVACIRDLWAEWEDRRTTEIYARRPETSLWAQGVAEASDGPVAERETDVLQDIVGETALFDDLAVWPHDAVDTRADDGDARPRPEENSNALAACTTRSGMLSAPDPTGYGRETMAVSAGSSSNPDGHSLSTANGERVGHKRAPLGGSASPLGALFGQIYRTLLVSLRGRLFRRERTRVSRASPTKV